jgi:hypothetical protein
VIPVSGELRSSAELIARPPPAPLRTGVENMAGAQSLGASARQAKRHRNCKHCRCPEHLCKVDKHQCTGLCIAPDMIDAASISDRTEVQDVFDRKQRGALVMTVKLNRTAFDYAKDLIKAGRFVFDERDAWSEHQPSTREENDFIERHGFEEYAEWHLGINEEKPEQTKGRYEFPYGNFKDVHRCGVLTRKIERANISISTSKMLPRICTG